jgi:hypothetical protein
MPVYAIAQGLLLLLLRLERVLDALLLLFDLGRSI